MEIIELLGFGAKGWGALILTGMLLTLCVTLASLAIGALVGGLIATAKLSNFWWLRVLGTTYTTIFRGVPELLIIYLISSKISFNFFLAGKFRQKKSLLSINISLDNCKLNFSKDAKIFLAPKI